MNTIYDVAFIGVLLFLLLVYILIDFMQNGKRNFVRRRVYVT
ncbi:MULTISPECIES: hypothetical protein [Sporosarcina]|uniref:Uncharacterized protein n=1 Tax=Sporosarcina contaminans TaxID=633403 RepID=A0ABW3U0K1_9BACL